ncbi:Two-component system response regulator, transcriptional regulatory protein yesN [Thermobacillus xylanilyticus]|uniref:Two-component system response regulator, transcriptional regulatory protein yesN n=1 Tax=Thermobacillus xylanilyticus TaxID=76633 RepID=A0ABN7RJ65_THEXY|nr:Two-component system response regulator, transcriptional regulatory protein yesN [Thermobacillus xylanilyticus]
MKKVFLVDDEIVVRENMRNCIDWEKEGFVYCGDAPDGELALPLIEKLKPDILITDIRMPFMNGLELSAIVRKMQPGIKIIILSGHDEFEYARQAIRIGVEDYCLKPVSAEDIIRVLRVISAKEEASETHRSLPAGRIDLLGHESLDYPLSLDREGFVEFLKVGSPEQKELHIRRFAKDLENVDWESSLYGFFLLHDLTLTIFREAGEQYGEQVRPDDWLPEMKSRISAIRSWEAACEYLDQLAELFWHWRSQSSDRYSVLIARVKQFVQEHYGDERLSLHDAARHVNVSPSHLSKVFSQETGTTFIEYVMETRIKKAMELLLSTKAKSYEIACRVGYQDPHYFSNVFKRLTGMTIRDFRKRGKAGQPVVQRSGHS